MGILVICTGNTCRSPMAEALLRHHLEIAGRDIAVASAGTLGWNGKSATDHAVDVLEKRGVALSGHISRKLSRELLDDADLVLAMTRTHAWAAAAYDHEAASRTFLLDEVVRLGEQAGPRGSEPLESWIAALDATRPPDRLGRAAEEVADPAGEPFDVYKRCADRLERSVRRLIPLL